MKINPIVGVCAVFVKYALLCLQGDDAQFEMDI